MPGVFRDNPPSKIKAIQFTGSPFQGKEAERLRAQAASKKMVLISTKGKSKEQITKEAIAAAREAGFLKEKPEKWSKKD